MTQESWSAFIVFLILCASAAIGAVIRPRLPEHHREKQTTELLHRVIAMLIAFTGLVLGLLITSAKNDFAGANHDRQQYAFQLTELDQCLRNYGAGGPAAASTALRVAIRGYTASVIAGTWPNESRPPGITTQNMPGTDASPGLANIMNSVELGLRHLTPANQYQAGILPTCQTDFENVAASRWAVTEDVQSSISTPLYWIMVFWLTVIFITFGMDAPRNVLVLLGIFMCAISLSLAVFVIADLSSPYGGVFSVPSTDMRAALAQMAAP